MWKKPSMLKPTKLDRQNVLKAFTRSMKNATIDAKEAEEFLFKYHKEYHVDYFDKATNVLWNIRQSPQLLQKHTFSSLFCCSDEHLREGSSAEQWYLELDEEKKAQKEIMEYVQQYNAATDTTGSMECGKCKSQDIASMQQQTRGADEAITTFLFCRNCSARWRI